MRGGLSPAWQWGAAGKHPVVKDYIRLGAQTPLLNVFARWVEEGYPVPADTAPRSWRFFAKGRQRDELACGFVRDSRDGVGRSFPFLILGSGVLEGWTARWEIVPLACDAAWERMEYLAAKQVFDLNELKGAIARLPSPSFPAQDGSIEPASELPPEEGGVETIPLQGTDQARDVASSLMRLKQTTPAAPEAIFIGGLVEHPRMVVFTRTLNTADFGRLWRAV